MERDADAFRELYRLHYAPVCRFLAARGERAVVEDVAAEVFLAAWRRRAELPDPVLPWLLGTAARCLANHRRGDGRRAALSARLQDGMGSSAASLDGDLEGAALRRALAGALAKLNDADRELLLLHHWDGLPPRDVATVLEINPVTARARLHRAGRRLQRALDAALAQETFSPFPVEETTHVA